MRALEHRALRTFGEAAADFFEQPPLVLGEVRVDELAALVAQHEVAGLALDDLPEQATFRRALAPLAEVEAHAVERLPHALGSRDEQARVEAPLACGLVGEVVAQERLVPRGCELVEGDRDLVGKVHRAHVDGAGEEVGGPHEFRERVAKAHRGEARALGGDAARLAQDVAGGELDLHHGNGELFLKDLGRAAARDDGVEVLREARVRHGEAALEVSHVDGEVDVRIVRRDALQNGGEPRVGRHREHLYAIHAPPPCCACRLAWRQHSSRCFKSERYHASGTLRANGCGPIINGAGRREAAPQIARGTRPAHEPMGSR